MKVKGTDFKKKIEHNFYNLCLTNLVVGSKKFMFAQSSVENYANHLGRNI